MSEIFRGDGAGARTIAIIAVAVLAVGVGLLSVFALEQGKGGATPTNSPRPAPSFTFGDNGTPSATPPPTATTPATRGEERFLALQGNRLWRATGGVCGGVAPVVELSTDGGASWVEVTPGGGLAQVLGVAALAEIDGEVVGAVGDDCEPSVLRTYTSGIDWESYDALGSVVYLSPSDGVTVHAPGVEIAAPCDAATSVRMSRGTIGLMCEGTAYRLSEADDWTALTTGAVALDAVGGNLVVAHTTNSCDNGVAVTRFEESTASQLSCIDGADPAAPAALSMLGNDIVLWSGTDVLRP